LASKSSIPFLEDLLKQCSSIVSAVNKLPFSDEVKRDIISKIESHLSTAVTTLKRAYEEDK
jgi:hypothetical protein